MKETPEQQAANRELRKGTKRPEHSPWPVAKLGKHKALQEASKGHKHGEREARSKKAGFYVHGHKNYGDVYEE